MDIRVGFRRDLDDTRRIATEKKGKDARICKKLKSEGDCEEKHGSRV